MERDLGARGDRRHGHPQPLEAMIGVKRGGDEAGGADRQPRSTGHGRRVSATSPVAIDAITAQVVAELQKLQQAAGVGKLSAAPPAERSQIEIELIGNLRTVLGRLFRGEKLASTIQRKLSEVSKRFARLFFASELHEKMGGSSAEAKAMRHGEQALFHALSHVQPALVERR